MGGVAVCPGFQELDPGLGPGPIRILQRVNGIRRFHLGGRARRERTPAAH
jgi:hypothetical protein